MYYILESSPNVGDIVINEHNIEEVMGFINNGKPINENFEYFLEAKNKTGKLTDYISSGRALPPIISDKFKNLLSNLKEETLENIQFIPIKINNHNKSNKEYFIFNSLNNIKCFDWEKSKYTRFPSFLTKLQNFPNKIEELVFNNKAIGSRNIFRMYESNRFIFISKEMKDILEANNITGIEFLELEKINDPFALLKKKE